mmetsp:Transcript_63638/g.170472  ORF Transcript_63638/g.170472 Transcript_63638/m.170472 type:complete len:204 (+) Transcript_63638:1681-2292(+)
MNSSNTARIPNEVAGDRVAEVAEILQPRGIVIREHDEVKHVLKCSMIILPLRAQIVHTVLVRVVGLKKPLNLLDRIAVHSFPTLRRVPHSNQKRSDISQIQIESQLIVHEPALALRNHAPQSLDDTVAANDHHPQKKDWGPNEGVPARIPSQHYHDDHADDHSKEHKLKMVEARLKKDTRPTNLVPSEQVKADHHQENQEQET